MDYFASTSQTIRLIFVLYSDIFQTSLVFCLGEGVGGKNDRTPQPKAWLLYTPPQIIIWTHAGLAPGADSPSIIPWQPRIGRIRVPRLISKMRHVGLTDDVLRNHTFTTRSLCQIVSGYGLIHTHFHKCTPIISLSIAHVGLLGVLTSPNPLAS